MERSATSAITDGPESGTAPSNSGRACAGPMTPAVAVSWERTSAAASAAGITAAFASTEATATPHATCCCWIRRSRMRSALSLVAS